MTRADDQALYEQLETLYALDPDQRRLFTLATILPRTLAQQLQRWVQGGQYAALFDHVEDTLTLAPFQYVDFEGLDSVPLVLEPLLFYLLHRATATVIDPALRRTAQGVRARRSVAVPPRSDHSRVRHRGAQDVAEEERLRAPGHAVQRGPAAVGAAAGRDRELSDHAVSWRTRTSIARATRSCFT